MKGLIIVKGIAATLANQMLHVVGQRLDLDGSFTDLETIHSFNGDSTVLVVFELNKGKAFILAIFLLMQIDEFDSAIN